jgi:hypothetical protein
MRRLLPVILVVILAIALVIYYSLNEVKEAPPAKLTGMPWQIEILPDGHSKVFGLVPGKTTLREAIAVLGTDNELAIVENKTSTSLEMYFSHYQAGPLSAKLVLAAKTDPADIQQWKQRAIKKDYIGMGKAKKYTLATADLDAALNSVLRAIAFIPAVNLDDDIVRKRFGEPKETIGAEPDVTYYLYPKQGLSITLSPKAKEVLQYVAPPDFASLRAPLHSN